MAADRNKPLEPVFMDETHANRQSIDNSTPGNAPASTAHGIRPPSDQYHHKAFMQCRACCNCNAQCSYYGKGHFDSVGNYVKG